MNGDQGEMSCAEARDGLLEADLPQLSGDGGDALANHLRTCGRCQEIAQAILEGERDLGGILEALVPAPDLDALLAMAAGDVGGANSVLRRRFRRAIPPLIPLAAAAVLVALFFGREPSLPGEPVFPAPTSPGLGLEVPEGRDVAVLATGNPDITVLWFF
jgi:hypothetical protein